MEEEYPDPETVIVPTVQLEGYIKPSVITGTFLGGDIDPINLNAMSGHITIEGLIMFEEGYRHEPYLCSEGYVTIDFGLKLSDTKGLNPKDFVHCMQPKEDAIKDLKARLELAQGQLNLAFGSTYSNLSHGRRLIIQSMAYQLGIDGVRKFKKMWAMIEAENYLGAAHEMLDSKWSKQTPCRADRHEMVMRCNDIDLVYGELV